jgi:hypothetical protein
MNQKMFKKDWNKDSEVKKQFGISGHLYAGEVALLAGQLVRKYGKLTLLDYGCGQGTFGLIFPPITNLEVKEYDPCVPGKSEAPGPADVVVCTDVLEHIEPECLENVLNDLQRLTKKVIFLAICLSPSGKRYSDGQNCHLSQLPFDIWFAKIRKRFNITEASTRKSPSGHDMFVCIAQAKEIK